jgi:hypothetical protein
MTVYLLSTKLPAGAINEINEDVNGSEVTGFAAQMQFAHGEVENAKATGTPECVGKIPDR